MPPPHRPGTKLLSVTLWHPLARDTVCLINQQSGRKRAAIAVIHNNNNNNTCLGSKVAVSAGRGVLSCGTQAVSGAPLLSGGASAGWMCAQTSVLEGLMCWWYYPTDYWWMRDIHDLQVGMQQRLLMRDHLLLHPYHQNPDPNILLQYQQKPSCPFCFL